MKNSFQRFHDVCLQLNAPGKHANLLQIRLLHISLEPNISIWFHEQTCLLRVVDTGFCLRSPAENSQEQLEVF